MLLNNRKHLVFIESNTTGTGELFLRNAINNNFEVLFFTNNPEKYTFLKEYLVHPIIIDTQDECAIINYLSSIQNIQAILSTSEFFIEICALVAKQLNLIHNNPIAIELCRNKDMFYERLHKLNHHLPFSMKVKSPDEAVAALKHFKERVIVKPCNGSGSIGVKLCSSTAEVSNHIKNLLDENQYIVDKKPLSFLIQEFINGDEYSIETFSQNGLHTVIGITKKHLGPLPYFIESGHDFPALCSQEVNHLLRHSVMEALDAVQFTNGPAHTEVRIVDDKAYIIEINPRLAGGMIPILIQAATNIDLIQETINFFTGKEIHLTSSKSHYASIRFLIANSSGVIKKIKTPSSAHVGVYHFKMIKNEENVIDIKGDFRDRLGYVITVDPSPEKSKKFSEEFLKEIEVIIESKNNTEIFDFKDTGILKDTCHPEALKIIHRDAHDNQKISDFHSYAIIDEVHILMLVDCKIMKLQDAQKILQAIRQLKSAGFNSLLERKAPRGTYLLYENELISQLGLKVAGSIQKGRSRNDLQETIVHISMRNNLLNVYYSLWRLRSRIITLSQETARVAFPIYSQYQTALPGTFSHYLLGIEEALSRDQIFLQDLFKFINVSPLGAGAGGGTSFPIDPTITAKFLGFYSYSKNSLDAIASKDLALRYISMLNITGSTLSRLVEDLQLWSTDEYKFIFFPDNLVGGSSMMPQKRNPYLLEEIKAKLSEALGCLMSSFISVNTTPFGNSYETKTVLSITIKKTNDLLIDAMDLTRIILEGIQLAPQNILKSLKENLTFATLAAEMLSLNLFSYKEAHKKVGETIYQAKEKNSDAFASIVKLLSDNGLSISSEPIEWAFMNDYGCGAGRLSTNVSLINSIERLHSHSHWWHEKQDSLRSAENLKDERIAMTLRASKRNV